MSMRIGRYSKIKVDVKIVSDHPYPWHSGSPETAPEDLQNQKIQIEVAELINPESQMLQNKKRWY
jgi:ATP-dependent RNA helicase RhlE